MGKEGFVLHDQSILCYCTVQHDYYTQYSSANIGIMPISTSHHSYVAFHIPSDPPLPRRLLVFAPPVENQSITRYVFTDFVPIPKDLFYTALFHIFRFVVIVNQFDLNNMLCPVEVDK